MKKVLKVLFIVAILFFALNILSSKTYFSNAEEYTEKNNNNQELQQKNDDNLIINGKSKEESTKINSNKQSNTTTNNNVIEGNQLPNDLTNNEDKKDNSNSITNTNSQSTKKSILKAAPIQSTKKQENTVKLGVNYDTHIQNIGWETNLSKKDGDTSGTTGRGLRLEGIHIKLYGTESSNLKVKYQVHVQNIGWQNWNENGAMAGTTGRSLRLEAIKIRLESSDDYSIQYRVHVQNIGWQDWKTDGDIAGTTGKGLRLEAIEIKIVPKVKKVSMYIDTPSNNSVFYTPSKIQVYGWKMANIKGTKIRAYMDNTEITNVSYNSRNDVIKVIEGYGTEIENKTPGFSFSINTSDTTKIKDGIHTIKVDVCTSDNKVLKETIIKVNIDRKLHVQYQAHIQNIGWQGYVIDGQQAGTTGRGLRAEALKIDLINAPKNAKIKYRTHVQNIGWQGWQRDGQLAGTTGQSLRIEAIQIELENMDNYTVEYQVHVQGIGWTGWYIDGETAGTTGQSKRLEAIKIRIVPKYKHQYKGLDVSSFNGIVNWGQVKQSNIDFAFLRVGFRGYGSKGTLNLDSKFIANITQTNKLGIPTGVYFVTQATTEAEAIEEANWVINQIKNYKISYPVAIDIEAAGLEKPTDIPRTQNLDKNKRTYLASLFCKTIQNAGYTPIVYTNINWATNYLNMSKLSNYNTWIASYKKDITSGPGYNGSYTIWQYTSKGSITGILGNVDLNICYKKY